MAIKPRAYTRRCVTRFKLFPTAQAASPLAAVENDNNKAKTVYSECFDQKSSPAMNDLKVLIQNIGWPSPKYGSFGAYT